MNQVNASLSKQLNLSPQANEQGETERDYTTSYGLILMAVVIIVGNCLVLLTVKSFKRRLVTDILIFALSLSDLTNTLTTLLLAIVFKFTLLHKRTGGKRQDVFQVLCQTQAWFTVTTQVQSVFIVTLISLERFVAVSHPFLYKARVNSPVVLRMLGVLFIVSASFSSAPLLGWDEYVCQPKLALCLFRYNSSFAILVVVIGYLHLTLVSYCFVSIRVSLKKFIKRQTYFARRRGAIAGPQTEKDKTSLKITKEGAKSLEQSKRLLKVSAIVSLLFYFCWLPLMVVITYAQITNRNNYIMSLVASLMPLTSPLVNPLIYFFSWERYKRSYIKIMKRFISCCMPYRRSTETKDLTKVPGPKSPILNLMRDSGSLGRLELVECANQEGDVCFDQISAPGSPTTARWSFDENTGSYSRKGLNQFGKKESKLSRGLLRYSFDKSRNLRRNIRMLDCIQADHSGRLSEKRNSQGKSTRRHTINEFSDKVTGSCTGNMGIAADSHNYVLDRSFSVSPNKGRYIIRAEGAIAIGTFPLNEREKKVELHHRRTSNDGKDLKMKYETSDDSKKKSEKGYNHSIDHVVNNSSGNEKDTLDLKKSERNLRRSSKTRTYCKEGGRGHIFDSCVQGKKTMECKRGQNQRKSLETGSCPITQRIHEYLASMIDDEESEESWKYLASCKNDRGIYSQRLEGETATSTKEQIVQKESRVRNTVTTRGTKNVLKLVLET